MLQTVSLLSILNDLKKIAVLFFLMLSFMANAVSQPYYFKSYQIENGLANNTVTCTLQDRKGFIWFGTKDGLSRFDGYTFKNYRNIPGDIKSLGNNVIHVLYEDADDLIWAGTDNGIYQFDPKTESFSALKAAPSGEVLNIQCDTKGNIWYTADKKLFKLIKSSGTVKMYDLNNSGITSVCVAPGGKVWLASSSGYIYEYNETDKSFKHYDLFSHSAHVASPWIVKLYSADSGQILAGTINQGLKLFNTADHKYTDILPYNQDNTGIFVRDILAYKKDEIWLATEAGVYIYNLQTKVVVNLAKQYNDPYSISYNSVYSLYKDSEGGLWAGTYFGGVNYYSPKTALFKKYFPQYNGNSLTGTAIRRIVKDGYGNLWIGTEDAGLNKLNIATGAFTNFKPNGAKNSLSYTNIHGLLAIGDKLWIGTYEHGLDIMDIKSQKIIKHYQISNQTHTIESNLINCIYQTRSKEIYIVTGYGLYHYDKAKDDFTFIFRSQLQTIEEDTHGIIWAGTRESGVFTYDPVTGQVKNESLVNKGLNINQPNNNVITGIFEDSGHELWFSTENGLYEFNAARTKITSYSTADELPSNITCSILEDGNKNLWIGTSGGLVALNLLSKKVTTYTVANGLPNNQLNYDSAYKDESGNMYFGSVKGLISFNPAAFDFENKVSPVYITGFQVNNEELKINGKGSPLKSSVIGTKHIVLKYDQSSFSIDFAAPNFTAPQMLQYAYRMEGIDTGWTILKANRKVYFTGLKPGSYTFKVKARGNNGFTVQPPTSLVIEIAPPFWASYYAYFIYACILAGIIYYLVRANRLRQEERNKRKFALFENEKQREIYQAKIEFFTHITHEIRTPLTLIKGPLDNIIKKNDLPAETEGELKLLEKNTNRLLELTNQLLDFRKVESQGLNLNFVRVDINAFLQDIFLDFKLLGEQKKQSFQISLPEKALPVDADTDALHKILNNLFTNAVKYAESMVSVKLYTLNNEFIIEVKNDGHPVPDELKDKIFEPFFRVPKTNKQQGNGIGLALCRSLAELHNGTLTFQKYAGNLNMFILALPFHQADTFTFYNDEEPNAEINIPDTDEADPAKPMILVVEDNPEISTFLVNALSHHYAVVTAANGQQALDVLQGKTVQLILSDVLMPVMDGFELCKRVKTTLDFSHIPIVLLTAKNALQSKIEGLESGADAYIEKPFSPEHLLVQISNLLKNRNNIKLHFASSPLINIKSIAYSKADEVFLEKLNAAILNNITDTELDVDALAETMNMSRPTLYRKIKAISDLSPNELIQVARLKKAAELLADGDLKIYEIANLVGYSSQTYFGHTFFKQFGMTPSEYAQRKRSERKTNETA